MEYADLGTQRMKQALKSFLRTEYHSILYALITCAEAQGVLIVSNPYTLSRATNKIYQQRIAKQVGVKVAEQVLTNSIATFSQFYEQNPACLFKPIYNSTYIAIDKQQFFTYPTLITQPIYEAIKNKEIDFHVYHFQEKLAFVCEYRVVVFGNEVYAFKIEGNYELDWRKDLKAVTFEAVPNFVYQDLCLTYMQAMQINFGSFDFIETSEGTYFIECNSPGYFLFCDKNQTVGLAQKFANFLCA